jgi:hypothetical protein
LFAALAGFTLAGAETLAANSQVEVAYTPPTNPDFQYIYQQIKTRGILEQLAQFLSPLKLPHKITLQTGQCGATYVPYTHGPVTICYEYLVQILRLAPEKEKDGVSRANAITGAVVQVALHNVAEAVFEELEVPIWGREEDAADKVAGLISFRRQATPGRASTSPTSAARKISGSTTIFASPMAAIRKPSIIWSKRIFCPSIVPCSAPTSTMSSCMPSTPPSCLSLTRPCWPKSAPRNG